MNSQSETIGKLGEALAKAQGQMENASKDKSNPFYKSKYADLASVWEACREPLSKNGLSVTQTFSAVPLDSKMNMILYTTLIHASGEWIKSEIPVNPVKTDPQSIGSAITYFRRFALGAIVGITSADDDGNSASDKKETPEIKHQKTLPELDQDIAGVLCKMCDAQMITHFSRKGYICPNHGKDDKLHLKFPFEDLQKYKI